MKILCRNLKIVVVNNLVTDTASVSEIDSFVASEVSFQCDHATTDTISKS